MGKKKKEETKKKKSDLLGIESRPFASYKFDLEAEKREAESPGGVAPTCCRVREVGMCDCCIARCSSAGAVESSHRSHRKERELCTREWR